MKINLNLNGKDIEFDSSPGTRLVDLLKTSTKIQSLKTNCYKGICRGCAIFFNGDLVSSCLIPAFQARDAKITTFEWLNRSNEIKDIISGFKDIEYNPCKFCRSGKIMTIHSILEIYVDPDDYQIMEAFEGMNCSCTDRLTLISSVKAGAYYRKRKRSAKNI